MCVCVCVCVCLCVLWNDKFRKSRVLLVKLIAVVTPDNLCN